MKDTPKTCRSSRVCIEAARKSFTEGKEEKQKKREREKRDSSPLNPSSVALKRLEDVLCFADINFPSMIS